MDTGKKIKELRKKAGISLADLAEILGVSRATAGNYESGHTEPSHEKLVLLSEYFGVTVDNLIKLAWAGQQVFT